MKIILKRVLNSIRGIFAIGAYFFLDQATKKEITLDTGVLQVSHNSLNVITFIDSLSNEPFRNVFYYRVSASNRIIAKILICFSKLFLPPIKSVELTGGGYWRRHSYST